MQQISGIGILESYATTRLSTLAKRAGISR